MKLLEKFELEKKQAVERANKDMAEKHKLDLQKLYESLRKERDQELELIAIKMEEEWSGCIAVSHFLIY